MTPEQQHEGKLLGWEIMKVGADLALAFKHNKSTKEVFELSANYCRTINPLYELLQTLMTKAANEPTIEDLDFMPECPPEDCE
jgi:hypothetical protein